MPGKFEAPRGSNRRRRKKGGSRLAVILLIIFLLLAAALGVKLWLDHMDTEPDNTDPAGTSQTITPNIPDTTGSTAEPTAEPTTIPTETAPPQHEVIANATVSAQGDLLMHKPIFNSCKQSGGKYDYSYIFRYMAPYLTQYDYSVVNLETTLGGDDCGVPYQGNPLFNCPDGIEEAVIGAGYDMLLTANNHASDTKAYGIKRTLERARNAGLDTLGTMLSDEEAKYAIVDVNGIKIGMLCYTYASDATKDGRPSLNGNAFVSEKGLVNYFTDNNLDAFYKEVEGHLAAMEAEGAEATMIFMHWGIEYQTKENSHQRKIAQKLCDLGIDVIIGGHPHVVQPIALLESTVDASHKTVCIYSLGNAVSNQRTGYSDLFPAGYTEDGILFCVTFEKYSDGNVYVAGTDVLPTWVNMRTNNGYREYDILPLDMEYEEEWDEMFGLTENQFGRAQKSYNRTMGIVGDGLQACQEYLEQAKRDREQYYYDLAHPTANNAA